MRFSGGRGAFPSINSGAPDVGGCKVIQIIQSQSLFMRYVLDHPGFVEGWTEKEKVTPRYATTTAFANGVWMIKCLLDDPSAERCSQ